MRPMATKAQIKSTGATFTPKPLASYLANLILKYATIHHKSILDPACGHGELLLAIGDKLSDKKSEFKLTGYDSDDSYLNFAKKRLQKFDISNFELFHGDFLNAIDVTNKQTVLNFINTEKSRLNGLFDIVIANPPYVRTQILGTEKAQALANKFNLKGRVDLYHPFLIAMTESLKVGGLLGVITSNRYLSTKSGEAIRKYLSENFEILELIDLGDTKIFDAAVLPAIFIGRKCRIPKTSKSNFIKVYEELNGYRGPLTKVDDVFEVLSSPISGYFSTDQKRYKKSSGTLIYEVGSSNPWEILSTEEASWVSKIDLASKYKVGDFFKVKVGIKSTADKVFISDKWDDLGVDKPEDEILKELVSQENIGAWGTVENIKLKVLYPHVAKNGHKETVDIEKYPIAKRYFLKHEEVLKARKYLIESGRKWYELWVSHKPDQWVFPKLVFPDISLKPRFFFDTSGKIVNGNCYWISAEKKDDIDKLLFIQGIANSKLMTKYHDLVFNNKLYSGRRRYITQYVERYPLPEYSSEAAIEVISLVKQLNFTENLDQISILEKELEIKVAKCFNIEPVFNLD